MINKRISELFANMYPKIRSRIYPGIRSSLLAITASLFITACSEVESSAPDGKTKKQAGAHPTELSAGLVNPGYEEKPKWFKLSFLDLPEDIKEATAANKRLMLYFYQDGCPYCAKLIHDNFGQRDIAKKTRATVDALAINLWGSNEVTDMSGKATIEKDFARTLNVNFTPTLLFLNEKGEVIYRVNGYYFPDKFSALLDYIKGKQETKVSFREYYNKIAPQPANAKLNYTDGIIKPPYDFAKIQKQHKKPLLVMFEQGHCKVCDELHNDILKRQLSKNELGKLNVALLDMWSKEKIVTPSGESLSVFDWAKKLNVNYTPSLVFFDEAGKEVFRTEAYLKAFHIQGAMAYVNEKAYIKQPNFQRYLSARREEFEKKTGKKVELWR